MKKTLYGSVQEFILKYISDNNLLPGDKLPTFRKLADLCGTSTYTISTAVENLSSRGVLEIRPQSGVFIARDAFSEMFPNELSWDKYTVNRKSIATKLSLSYATNPKINMSYPFFCEEFGWYPVLKQSVSEALQNITNPDCLNNLHGAQGYLPLREEISEYLKNYGVVAKPEEIIIGSGAFATRQLILSEVFHECSMYFIPSPSLEESVIFSRVYKNIEVVQVPFDNEGMSAEYIASKINPKKKALLLVSPVIQSQNGQTMSMQRRKDIYNLCYKSKIPIVEMDEYRDFHNNPLPPLKAIDKHNIVIYIGTFERVLTRTIGVSWVVSPPRLVDDLVYTNGMFFQHFDVFDQMTAYEAMRSGLYRRLTQDIKQKLKTHYALFNALLNEYLGDIATWDSSSQIFFWLRFADYIDVDRMAAESDEITFMHYAYYKFAPKNALCITPIRFAEAELVFVIQKLSQLARRCVK